MIPYCLPIQPQTLDEFSRIVSLRRNEYLYFELWVDYLEDASPVAIRKIADELQDQLVVVFRRNELKPIHLSLEQRMEIIHGLVGSESYVDLDVTQQKSEIMQVPKNAFRLMLSYHDFVTTPDDTELLVVTENMAKAGAYISKIACQCSSPSDAVRLLSLFLKLRAEQREAIVLGMGTHGAVTRVFGTLWGNKMIFAPPDRASATAPGQLTRPELEHIFTKLDTESGLKDFSPMLRAV